MEKKDKAGKSNKRSGTTTLEGVLTGKKKKKKSKAAINLPQINCYSKIPNVKESLSHHPNRSHTEGIRAAELHSLGAIRHFSSTLPQTSPSSWRFSCSFFIQHLLKLPPWIPRHANLSERRSKQSSHQK